MNIHVMVVYLVERECLTDVTLFVEGGESAMLDEMNTSLLWLTTMYTPHLVSLRVHATYSKSYGFMLEKFDHLLSSPIFSYSMSSAVYDLRLL